MRPALWMDDKPLSSKEPVIFKVIRYVIQKPLSLSFRELQVWLKQLRLFPSLKDLSQIVWKHWISIKLLFIGGRWSPFFFIVFFFIEFFFVWNFCDHSLPHRFWCISPNIVKRQNGRQSEVSVYVILITYLLPINFKVWVEEKRLLS